MMLNQYMVFRDQVTNIFWNLAKTIPSRSLRHFSSILGKQAVDQGELGTGLLGNQNLLLNLNGDFCFCLSCNETLDRGQLGTGLYSSMGFPVLLIMQSEFGSGRTENWVML